MTFINVMHLYDEYTHTIPLFMVISKFFNKQVRYCNSVICEFMSRVVPGVIN